MTDFNLRLAVLHARVLQHHANAGRKELSEYRDMRLSQIIRKVYKVAVPPHVVAQEARQYDLDNQASGWRGQLPTDDPYAEVHSLQIHLDDMHEALSQDDDDA